MTERTYTESEVRELMRKAFGYGYSAGDGAKSSVYIDRLLRDHAPTSEATGEERTK